MIKSVKDMIRGMLGYRWYWMLWMLLLGLINLGGGIVYLHTLEGKLALSSLGFALVVMLLICHLVGFTRLLGIGHLPWFFLVPYFFFTMDQYPSESLFYKWMLSLVIVNSLSLVIDTVDVIRYFKGERAPLNGL